VDDAALSAARLTMRARVRRSLHWAGSALAAPATALVGLRAHEYWRQLGQFHAPSAPWTLVFVLALLYGAANLLLASARRQLLARHGVRTTRMWSIRLFRAVALGRLVTVIGDLLFFAAACLIPADRAVLGEHHG
jgi:hypothetical protein